MKVLKAVEDSIEVEALKRVEMSVEVTMMCQLNSWKKLEIRSSIN